MILRRPFFDMRHGKAPTWVIGSVAAMPHGPATRIGFNIFSSSGNWFGARRGLTIDGASFQAALGPGSSS